MAETTKLGLPLISGNLTWDVVRDMNALADAVDAKAGVAGGLATLGADGKVLNADGTAAGEVTAEEFATHKAEKASLNQVGHVQLSNSTTSTSDALAATPGAVKKVMDAVNKIGYVTGIYTGNDVETRFINLGFTPSAVFVMPNAGHLFNNAGETFNVFGLALTNTPVTKAGVKYLEVVTNGFNVFARGSYSMNNPTPYSPYRYIAFK